MSDLLDFGEKRVRLLNPPSRKVSANSQVPTANSKDPTSKSHKESRGKSSRSKSSNEPERIESESSRRIISICENRAHEVGIALVDLNRLQNLQVTQFIDTTSYSYTVSFVQQ